MKKTQILFISILIFPAFISGQNTNNTVTLFFDDSAVRTVLNDPEMAGRTAQSILIEICNNEN